jgi:hypothetical protein
MLMHPYYYKAVDERVGLEKNYPINKIIRAFEV